MSPASKNLLGGDALSSTKKDSRPISAASFASRHGASASHVARVRRSYQIGLLQQTSNPLGISIGSFSVPLGQSAANETGFMTNIVRNQAGVAADTHDFQKQMMKRELRAKSGHMRYGSLAGQNGVRHSTENPMVSVFDQARPLSGGNTPRNIAQKHRR